MVVILLCCFFCVDGCCANAAFRVITSWCEVVPAAGGVRTKYYTKTVKAQLLLSSVCKTKDIHIIEYNGYGDTCGSEFVCMVGNFHPQAFFVGKNKSINFPSCSKIRLIQRYVIRIFVVGKYHFNGRIACARNMSPNRKNNFYNMWEIYIANVVDGNSQRWLQKNLNIHFELYIRLEGVCMEILKLRN